MVREGGTPPHAETFLLWREGAVTTPLYRSWWGEGEFGGLFPQASIGVRRVKKGTLPAADFFIGGKMEGHSKPSFIRWFSSTFIYRGEVGWAALFLTFSNHLFFVFFNLAKFNSVLHFESSRGTIFYHKWDFTVIKFRLFRKICVEPPRQIGYNVVFS